MNNHIIAICFVYGVTQVAVFFLVIVENGWKDVISICRGPKEIYEESKYNYPTCVLLCLLSIVAFLIPNIFRFIHFLTHVGRKED